jgi:predicted XRE-type DNA-binding protein
MKRRHAEKAKTRITPSSGNVFRDVGFSREESAHLLVRSDLLIQLQKRLESRGLKQAEAAKILRVTEPRVSDLLRGRIDLFSTDALIDMLARLGVLVRLVVLTCRLSSDQSLLENDARYMHLSPAALDAALKLLDGPQNPAETKPRAQRAFGEVWPRSFGDILETAANPKGGSAAAT